MTSRRTIDTASDEFVTRYCALDPITATDHGVAGHEAELPDLGSLGLDPLKAALARV